MARWFCILYLQFRNYLQCEFYTILQNNREADRKMAGIQYSLEERANLERKHKKQVNGNEIENWNGNFCGTEETCLTITISPQIACLKEKVSHEELRSSRDEEALVKLKQRMEVIGMRRKAKEEKKKGNWSKILILIVWI